MWNDLGSATADLVRGVSSMPQRYVSGRSDVPLSPTELADLFQQLLDAMTILGRLGYAHGDLSAYNLLVHEGQLILIDLPQLVDIVTNPQGRQFLERDAQRGCEWFVAHGLSADVADPEYVVDLVLAESGTR